MTTYLDLYAQIKSLEPVFQVPAPTLTVLVGTLNAATGTFVGLESHTHTDPEPMAHQPGASPTNPAPHYQGDSWVSVTISSSWRETINIVPAPKVGAAPVVLRFQVTNAGGSPLEVKIGGHTATAKPGDDYVLYNIWDLTDVTWTASCAGASHMDHLLIQRDPTPIPGIGAFTIPALPLSVVYAPPADAGGLSKTTYSQSQIVGTTTDIAIASDTSTTKPWLPTNLDDLNTFKTILSDLAGVLGKIPNVYAQAIGTACGVIAGGIGTMSGSQTAGTVDRYERAVTVTVSSTESVYAEAANGGPGQGDVIHYLRDAKVGWVLTGGILRLCLLGGVKASYPAEYLQQHAADTQLTNLAQDVTLQLLGLDPFVTGSPDMTLPTPRFTDVSDEVYGGALEFGGGQTITGSYSQTFSTSTSRITTEYADQMQDFNAGWLAQIFGSQSQTLRTQFSSTSAAGTTQTDTQTYSWELHSGPAEHFIIEFWLDQVFGTLAMRLQMPQFTFPPRLKGILKDLNGHVLPHHLVTLTTAAGTFRTLTDEKGRYAFHSAEIPAGAGTIEAKEQPLSHVRIAPVQDGPLGPIRPHF